MALEQMLAFLGYAPEYIKLAALYIDDFYNDGSIITRTGTHILSGIMLLVALLIVVHYLDSSGMSLKIKNRCFVDEEINVLLIIPFILVIPFFVKAAQSTRPFYGIADHPQHFNKEMELALVAKFKKNRDWVMKSGLDIQSKKILAFCLSPNLEWYDGGVVKSYSGVSIKLNNGDEPLLRCIGNPHLPPYLETKEKIERMIQ